jgi:hypothetical protein
MKSKSFMQILIKNTIEGDSHFFKNISIHSASVPYLEQYRRRTEHS